MKSKEFIPGLLVGELTLIKKQFILKKIGNQFGCVNVQYFLFTDFCMMLPN